MNSGLSISKAWDETKARLGSDGKLLFTVALALVALPSAAAQFINPRAGVAGQPQSFGDLALMLIVAIIGLIGQLALIRLAIGPSVSVGEAIAHGARRMPVYLVALILLVLALFLLAIPLVLILAAMGVTFEQGAPAPSGAAVAVMLLFVALCVYLAVRMLMTSPVASAEKAGPITIIKRSWQLTSGNTLRLLGFVLLILLAAFFALMAILLVTGALVSIMFGEAEPLSLAALIVALVVALFNAALTTVLVVMIARIYVQLSGGAPIEPSVPKTG